MHAVDFFQSPDTHPHIKFVWVGGGWVAVAAMVMEAGMPLGMPELEL